MEHLQRYITSINLQERNKNEKCRGAFRCYNLWDSLQQGWRLKHCSMPVAPHQWLRSVDNRAVPLSLKWNSTNCQSLLWCSSFIWPKFLKATLTAKIFLPDPFFFTFSVLPAQYHSLQVLPALSYSLSFLSLTEISFNKYFIFLYLHLLPGGHFLVHDPNVFPTI